MKREISRATLGRLPGYLKYLQSLPPEMQNISATALARALKLGEVQVRKDLSSVSDAGKPKIGYNTALLIKTLETFLNRDNGNAVIVGAGRLGRALLDYGGFSEYGLEIAAAFDIKVTSRMQSESGKAILPMHELEAFCRRQNITIGIITVPASAAQQVCSRLIRNNIDAIWNFAPCTVCVPSDVTVQDENMALSLAHLSQRIIKK